MNSGRDARQIKRARNEILRALRLLYPVALQADSLLRGMLMLFPMLEFEHFRRDLAYLLEKGYIERVIPFGDGEADPLLAPWKRRWFKLTASGLEISERSRKDPALHE